MRKRPYSTTPAEGLSLTREWSNLTSAALFLAPMIVILGLFNLFPALYSLYLSLFQWNGLSITKDFVGFANYTRLFSSKEFWNSFIVTIVYSTALTTAALALGLLLSVLLNRGMGGRTIYRTVYFLPVIAPTVAAGVVWKYLFDPSQGAINRLLEIVGVTGPAWLNAPSTALVAVIVVGVWKRVGFNLVVYLAALQSIPRSYYETAELEGASAISQFRFITFPLLGASTFFLTVTSLIEAFQVFDLVYVMTNGGPMRSTDVMGFYLYRYGFRYYEVGFASSIAYVMFTLLFLATLIQFKIGKQEKAQ